MNEEQWRDIQDYEGFYQVSDRGQVRRLPVGRRSGGLLKGVLADKKVLVTLSKHGKTRTVRVCVLVADAFVPKRSELDRYVTHQNLDYTDNRASNLRWRMYKDSSQIAITNYK